MNNVSKRNVAKVGNLKPLKTFPASPSGYDDIVYNIKELDLEVHYECYGHEGELRNGKLVFEFFVALSIESETNGASHFGTVLPPNSATLFEFDSDLRDGFRGFQIWFSNNQLITVVCQRVLVGNEMF
jgi:hypothetical protein